MSLASEMSDALADAHVLVQWDFGAPVSLVDDAPKYATLFPSACARDADCADSYLQLCSEQARHSLETSGVVVFDCEGTQVASIAMARWVAAAAHFVKNHEFTYYSETKRQAIAFLMIVKKCIEQTKGRKLTVLRQSPDEVVELEHECGAKVRIDAYPCAPNTLRDTGAKSLTGTVLIDKPDALDSRCLSSVMAGALQRPSVGMIIFGSESARSAAVPHLQSNPKSSRTYTGCLLQSK